MFPERMITDDLTADSEGFRMTTCLPWARSMPLSCVEAIEVSVDGTTVETDDLSIILNGVERPFAQLPECIDEYWFFSDRAELVVRHTGLVRPGAAHEIELMVALRAPYIFTGDGALLVTTERSSRSVIAGPS